MFGRAISIKENKRRDEKPPNQREPSKKRSEETRNEETKSVPYLTTANDPSIELYVQIGTVTVALVAVFGNTIYPNIYISKLMLKTRCRSTGREDKRV